MSSQSAVLGGTEGWQDGDEVDRIGGKSVLLSYEWCGYVGRLVIYVIGRWFSGFIFVWRNVGLCITDQSWAHCFVGWKFPAYVSLSPSPLV